MEKHLGRAIQGWLKAHNVSQIQAAEKVGMRRETLSRKLAALENQQSDTLLITKLIEVMPEIEDYLREFAAPGMLDKKPPPVNEVEFLRRENSALKLALEETEARAERLLRVVETLAAKQNQNQH